jgi:hypothetical protein
MVLAYLQQLTSLRLLARVCSPSPRRSTTSRKSPPVLKFNDLTLAFFVGRLSLGSLTAVATAPMWTLKSRMQTDLASGAKRRYKSVWSGLRKIAADEGFAALYKGLSPTLLGIGHVMLQFQVYEHIKQRLSNNCEDNVQPMHILVASSVSKVRGNSLLGVFSLGPRSYVVLVASSLTWPSRAFVIMSVKCRLDCCIGCVLPP